MKLTIVCTVLLAICCYAVAPSDAQACGCTEAAIGRKRRGAGGHPLVPGFDKNHKRFGKEPPGQVKKRDGLFMVADMLLLEKDARNFGHSHKKQKRSGTPLVTDQQKQTYLWKNNTVPWIFSAAGTGITYQTVESALAAFQAKLGNCIKFQRITSTAGVSNYVKVINGGEGSCYSYVGSVGGMQELSLGTYCDLPVIAQHEFMHALGFYHEHNRPDRDTAVTIVKEKILTDYCDNFEICKTCKTYAPYNTRGIMQYPSYAFGCQYEHNTILRKSDPTNLIDYNEVIQDSDVTAIKSLYGCN